MEKAPLVLGDLNERWRKGNFISLSLIALEEIRDTWVLPAETGEPVRNLELIQPDNYQWNDPLYVKMIHRFNNCNRRVAQFYHQIDPGNQRILLARRKWNSPIYGSNCMEAEMMSFFAWLSNMLSSIDVIRLEGIQYEAGAKTSCFTELWIKNPIVWFYSVLDSNQQQGLLDKYNRTEIAAWNRMHARPADSFDQSEATIVFGCGSPVIVHERSDEKVHEDGQE